MDLFRCGLVCAVGLAAGCASAPEAPPASSALELQASNAAELETIAVPSELQVLQLEVENIDPGTVVVCRQMLRPASNVIERRCMTRDDWEIYEKAVEMNAKQLLRWMQGSSFR